MIGSGLKKFANENGMKVSKGVAYGSLRGYTATLSEGSGYKQIVLTTKFGDPALRNQLQEQINQRNITREFRIQNLTFASNGICIVFTDNLGTMKKIEDFLDWFMPLLPAHGATDVNTCTECGGQLTGGCWKLIDGTAFHLHESCAEKVRRDIDEEDEAKRQTDTGSYGKGAVGAVLGALLGAVVWAVVLNLGYVASVIGLLIGWLAEKGYNLLHGKQGKGKVAILVIAIILGVLIGTFAADTITLVGMINSGELPGMVYGDIPAFILVALLDNSEYAAAVGSNILMGLLFAALGVFSLLRKAGKDVAKTKVIDLE